MRLVAGGDDVSWYIRGGELALQSILEVLDRNGIDFENFDAVLDFGCGCGRVTQHWGGTRVQLYGCDYNSELIQWASKNLPKVRFEVNTLSPTLAFSEAQFTFIYALSVFTHLTEPLQEGWMKELLRIVHPDGYLLITLHGSHYLSVMTADEQREFLTGRLVVREPTEAGSNTCATFHPERYVRERLAKRWQVVDFVPKGASGNPYQDIYLLRPQ
jgi:2-polyprenyl-3-methyl-5-hydroxy-6-metoxy-1,4-benzoquinol methylase